MALFILTKICTKCQSELPLESFYKQEKGRFGRHSSCKSCKDASVWASRQKNPENYKRHSRQWRENNPEAARKYDREYKRHLYKTNPAARVKAQERLTKRRKVLKDAPGSFTKQQWLDKLAYWGYRCYLCRERTDNLEAEHRIPIAKGGTHWISNIAPACKTCNAAKGTKTEQEFRSRL